MSIPTSAPGPINAARPVVRGRLLRYLRLLSLFAGVLALVHPPLLLRRISHLLPDIAEPFVMLGGMLLAAGGYFVIGLAGHRMRRSPPLRSLAPLLMMVPFGASATVVWHGGHPMLLRVCGFLMVFTLVLYMSFIYPLTHTPKPKSSRRAQAYSQPASRAMR
ncbi:hypothetical protein LK542_20875 [Massilia sp. IC2-477]|uniref:hypothetical protein n=1 Tax=Massilia sp. IC2-477 TaxID=2887198 RepID=UPI001D0FFE2F|nr:hypothetical protein [Massilia sp. IC2-477]MCC2958080.1 hypothetical protein [Massilia sp. IC2-477]